MNRRHQYQMRKFVELTICMLDIGVFTVAGAARHLAAHDIPIHVALRTLTQRSS